MNRFDVVTLFPQLFTEHFKQLPFKRALEKGLVGIKLWNLRDYAIDKRGTVDDKPYGGGTGMVLMVEPIYKALSDIYISQASATGLPVESRKKEKHIILLSPRGQRFTQEKAKEIAKHEQTTFICGRYEGVDARVEEHLAAELISIGDFVLSGGELPALTIMESVIRLIPGVLQKESALSEESFNEGCAEYPQYTRPENFINMTVPKVLVSGNHKEIKDWREKNKKRIVTRSR